MLPRLSKFDRRGCHFSNLWNVCDDSFQALQWLLQAFLSIPCPPLFVSPPTRISPICLSKYAPNGEFARRLCQRLHCSWKPLGYRSCIRSFTMSNITSRLRPTPHQSIHHKFSVHILSVVLEHWHIVVVLMHLPSSNYNHFSDKICWETLS